MRQKQKNDAKNTKDEAHWLKKMEEAALKVQFQICLNICN